MSPQKAAERGQPLPRVCISMLLLGPATHPCAHTQVPPHDEHACAQANMCEAPYQSCSMQHCAMLSNLAQIESRTSPASGQVGSSGSACVHCTSHSYEVLCCTHKAPTSQCNTTAGAVGTVGTVGTVYTVGTVGAVSTVSTACEHLSVSRSSSARGAYDGSNTGSNVPGSSRARCGDSGRGPVPAPNAQLGKPVYGGAVRCFWVHVP